MPAWAHGFLTAIAVLGALCVLSCTKQSDNANRWHGSSDTATGSDTTRTDRAGTTTEAAVEAQPTVAEGGPRDGGDAKTLRTSCTSVAHIGDSLTYYTRNSLTAAYQQVGAKARIDAYGGRAIKQKIPEDPRTGKSAAAAFVAQGFKGCWVVALGTNDTANIAAGAWYTRVEAIDEMMNAIDPTGVELVVWVNTYTTRATGYYGNANMVLWNEALEEAKGHWSNMRIYDWASEAATGNAPYSDGIHHTAAGNEVRNAAIARALVNLFPAP